MSSARMINLVFQILTATAGALERQGATVVIVVYLYSASTQCL